MAFNVDSGIHAGCQESEVDYDRLASSLHYIGVNRRMSKQKGCGVT